MLSHPQSQWYSVPRRNSPPRKSTPSWETNSWVSSLLHKPFFLFCFCFCLFYMDLLQFHLHEEISKAEAPRDGQWQERKEEATNTSHTIRATVFLVKCSVGNLSSFWHWRNQKPAQLPQITWRFHQLSSLFCHWPVPLYSLFQLHIWQPFPTSHHQPPPLLAQQTWQWTLQPEEGEGYSFHCA